jgi:cytoskeletal protein RodZ
MSFIMSRSSGLKQNHQPLTTNSVSNTIETQSKPTLQSISVSDLLKLSPQEIRNSLNAQQPQKQEKSSSVQQPNGGVVVSSGANIMNRPYGVNSTIPVIDMY